MDGLNDNIVRRLLDFAEENWTPFLQRCSESGMDEEEVEEEISNLVRSLQL